MIDISATVLEILVMDDSQSNNLNEGKETKAAPTALIKDICVIAGLVLGVISCCRDCSQDRIVSEMRFRQSAAELRPILRAEIADTGSPFSVRVAMARTDVEELARSQTSTAKIEVDRRISAKLSISLKNVGTVPARVYLTLCCDTTGYYPFLRRMLLNMDTVNDSILIIKYFGRGVELLVNDTNSVLFENNINFVDSGQFTIHCLVLYSNGFGNFYDTYVCAKYDAPHGGFKILRNEAGNDVKIDTRGLMPEIRLHETPVSTYHTYGITETEKINRLLDSFGIPQED